ncbi:MAG: carboxylesterase family protein [Eubacteriales bacterium]|nr:carboxylesterase family protein [Eubacteriales bacterium]
MKDLHYERRDGYRLYRNIRYARSAPFELPETVTNLQQEADACFYQPKIPGFMKWMRHPLMTADYALNNIPQSADAHLLHLYVPEEAKHAPVLIYLHGGGMQTGGIDCPAYHAGALAKAGILTVLINYRLGALHALRYNECDNRGFHDQLAALSWVHTAISTFGGDADNITLAGQSAGGMSALLHACGPDAGRLFHKVILMSAAEPIPRTIQAAEAISRTVMHKFRPDQDFFRRPNRRLLLKMKQDAMKVTVDDSLAATHFLDAPVRIPMLIGSCEEDMSFCGIAPLRRRTGITGNPTRMKKRLQALFGDAYSELMAAYAAINGPQDAMTKMIRIYGMLFHRTVYRQIIHAAAPVFAYRLAYAPPVFSGIRGAYHGADQRLFFDTTTIDEIGKKQVRTMQRDLFAFLRTGDPGFPAANTRQMRLRYYTDGTTQDMPFPMADFYAEAEKHDLFRHLAKRLAGLIA